MLGVDMPILLSSSHNTMLYAIMESGTSSLRGAALLSDKPALEHVR